MNQEQKHIFSFEPTLTLGALLQLILLGALLIAGWTHFQDAVSKNSDDIKSMENQQVQQNTILQEIQIEQTRTATILSDLDKRMSRDENKKD